MAAIAPPLETAVVVFASPAEPAPRVLPLTDEMTVGRLGYGHAGEPIRLADPLASAGRHALLRRTAEGLTVQDLGSANQTFRNGVALTQGAHLLHVGDVLQVGQSLLCFEHTLAGNPWPRDAQHLVDEVLASPADDRPREELARWLAARGDPRGEFIGLQLQATRDAHDRSEALLARYALAWAAPLPAPVESWTFERGFLASVRVREAAFADVLRQFHPLVELELLDPRGGAGTSRSKRRSSTPA